MTSLRATNDLDQFIIDFDKIYGPGEFAKQMEASIGVPEHLKNSNAASILLAKQIKLQEQDLQDLKPQRPPGQIFKTVEELAKERLEREGVERALYEEEREKVLRRQQQERLANEEEQQRQERMLATLASKGSLGGKRTHRRKRKVVRKRYSRRLKSRSNRRGRRM